MKLLRCMRGNTLRDKMRNECNHKKLKATLIKDKMKESRLKWFVHV